VDHLVQPLCRSRVTYSRLHRTLSRRVLNISKEGDSTTSPGSLFQCSITLRVKKFFLMFRRNFLCFILRPLPLVLSLGITERSLAARNKFFAFMIKFLGNRIVFQIQACPYICVRTCARIHTCILSEREKNIAAKVIHSG